MWELEKAGGKFDNFNSKQQKAIHELIDGLTEIPTKPNKDQYRVDNQSQYTKIVGRTYYNGEYALYAIQINPEKPDVPLNKNDAFQKVQKRRVQEKR